MPLRVADVASIFVKMRGLQDRSKYQLIESSSGAAQTHPTMAGDGVVSARKVPIVQEDTFECRDAVDVPRLLRAVRASLYETAQALGANVLVDEQCVAGPLCVAALVLKASSLQVDLFNI